MSEHGEVIRYIDELAARVRGEPGDPAFDRAAATPIGSSSIGPFADARRERIHHLTLASETAHMGAEVGPGAKLPQVRKALAKASHPIAAYQVAYNGEVLAAFRALDDELERRHDHVFAVLRTLGNAVDDTHEAARALAGRVDQAEATVDGTDHRQTELEATVDELRREVAALRARLDLALARIDELEPGSER